MSKPKFKVLIVVALLTLIAGCAENCNNPYYNYCLEQILIPRLFPNGKGGIITTLVPMCIKYERRIKPYCVQINTTEEEANNAKR